MGAVMVAVVAEPEGLAVVVEREGSGEVVPADLSAVLLEELEVEVDTGGIQGTSKCYSLYLHNHPDRLSPGESIIYIFTSLSTVTALITTNTTEEAAIITAPIMQTKVKNSH